MASQIGVLWMGSVSYGIFYNHMVEDESVNNGLWFFAGDGAGACEMWNNHVLHHCSWSGIWMKISFEILSLKWGRWYRGWRWWRINLRENLPAIALCSTLAFVIVLDFLPMMLVIMMGYHYRFPDDFSALTAMHKLNNKIIPNSNPPTKFRLNHTSLGGKQAMDRDYSLWIGDLSPDVDDYTLYKGFASRYPSVRLAKGNISASLNDWSLGVRLP